MIGVFLSFVLTAPGGPDPMVHHPIPAYGIHGCLPGTPATSPGYALRAICFGVELSWKSTSPPSRTRHGRVVLLVLKRGNPDAGF